MKNLGRQLSVLAAVAVIVVAGFASPASAATDVQVAVFGGASCLQATSSVTDATCAYGPTQSWTTVQVGPAGTYEFKITGTNNCMTTAAGNNVSVGMTTCTGAVSQLWLYAGGAARITSDLGNTPGGWTEGPFCLKPTTLNHAVVTSATACTSKWILLY